MIKLFWNTHNQKRSDIRDKKVKSEVPIGLNPEDEGRDLGWGIYHKKNSNTWIYEVLKAINYQVVENISDIEKDDILIIIDSSIEKKAELYIKLKSICSRIFLFHLGDEQGPFDLLPVYNNCDYIWRTFCSNKYFENNKVKCIPLGYKSGTKNKQKSKREYKWSFTGTPHKSSRHDLLFQFSEIKPFFCHKTQKFNEKIISVDEMSDILSSTEFMPCPNGFFHPETYRLYEALECGSIPIVEKAYNYYDRLFPNNPFIKVNIWSEAKPILKGWEKNQIEKKREECKVWWINYKNQLQEFVKKKIIS
tara:strand:+ start:4316 stop:5233 length:918 start_codon:yes stop_codon:yes gene_type:complete